MQLIPLGRLSLISLMLIGAVSLPAYAQLDGSVATGSEGSASVDVRPDSATTALASSQGASVGVGSQTTLAESTRAAIPPDNAQALKSPDALGSGGAVQLALSAEKEIDKQAREEAEKKAAAEQKQRAAAEAREKREAERAQTQAKARAEAEQKKAQELAARAKAAEERKARAEAARKAANEKKAAEEKARAEAAATQKAQEEAARIAAAEKKAAEDKVRAEATAKRKADVEARELAEKARQEKLAADRKAEEEAAKAAAAEKKLAVEKARAEAAAKRKAEAEAKALAEKARQEKLTAERKAEEEAARKAAEERKAAAELAKAEAMAKARAEAEEKARAEAVRKAAREAAAAEEKEKREAAAAAAKAKRLAEEAEAKARAEARAKAATALRKAEQELSAGRLDEAKAALDEAKAADEKHQRIAPFERRLTQAAESRAKREAEKAKREQEKANLEAARVNREQAAAAAAAVSASTLAPLGSDAPVPATNPEMANPIAEADRLAREGRRLLSEGNREGAMDSYRKAVALDSTNVEASARLRELEGGAANPSAVAGGVPPLTTAPAGESASTAASPEVSSTVVPAAPNFRPVDPSRAIEESQAAFQKGLAAYQSGRLDSAVQYWNQSLSLNGANVEAQRYLSQTRAEYGAYVRQNQDSAVRVQRAASASEKLSTPVTYDTAGEKSISEFLSAMSLIGDISFSVAPGVDPDVRITAKLDEVPLKDALDIVLLPMGLKWNRAGDVVTVAPDLRTKFFNLSGEQVTRLRTLLEKRTLQRYLYGPEGVPTMRSTELLLDESNNTLLVTDSQENINKVEAFLKDLQTDAPSGLQYKNFKIRPEEGQRIRALVDAILKTQSDAPYDIERRVLVDKDDLIVKDTPGNIAKVEQLLLDKNFLKKIETQKLGVQTFNLAPKEPIGENIEQVRELATNIVTVVKTILYAQSGETAASAEGRRYFYDPNTLQLTITDFPDNIRAVGDYINSLPQLAGSRRRSEIIYLKHQNAGEFATLLNRVLGIDSGTVNTGATGGGDGDSITRTVGANQEFTFRELRIRNVRVQEGATENEDDVTLLIRGTAQGSQEQTIREFRSVFVEDYEITALDIRPSSRENEGSARIEIRYSPQGQGANANSTGGGASQQDQQAADEQAQSRLAAQDTGLSIDTVDNLNALLIRYEDATQLAEIRGWIEALDTPVLQVSIETKMVTVYEQKAKEWNPSFNILDIKKAGTNNLLGNSSFAGNSVAGLSDSGLPFPTNVDDLLPGAAAPTVLNAVSDNINFQLQMLEAEGILNSMSGPHVLVENGSTADFLIESFDVGIGNVGGSSGSTNNDSGGNNDGGNNSGGNNNSGGTSSSGSDTNNIELSLSPTITQLGEIRMQFDNLVFEDLVERPRTGPFLDSDGTDTNITGITNSRNAYRAQRRTLTTVARVNNGGTIVLGGWSNSYSRDQATGVPILRSVPYVGKLFFDKSFSKSKRGSMLLFLTCNIVNP